MPADKAPVVALCLTQRRLLVSVQGRAMQLLMQTALVANSYEYLITQVAKRSTLFQMTRPKSVSSGNARFGACTAGWYAWYMTSLQPTARRGMTVLGSICCTFSWGFDSRDS